MRRRVKSIHPVLICLTLILISCGPSANKQIRERIIPDDVELFSGSRGSICWGTYVKKNEESGKDIFCIRAIEPQNNKLAFELELNERTDASAYFVAENGKSGRRLIIGDRIWAIISGGKLEARNMYTGEILEDHKSLQQKFPELKEGISFCESAEEMPGFIIHESKGKIYWLDTGKSLLTLVSAIPANIDFVFPKKEFRTLFVEQDGSLIIYAEKLRENEYKGYRRIAAGYKFDALPDTLKDSIRVNRIKPANPYYRGRVVLRNPLVSIVAHATAETGGKLQFSAVSNFNGQQMWTCTDELTLNKPEDVVLLQEMLKLGLYQKEFLLMQRKAPRMAASVDMSSGKVIWKNSLDSLFTNFKE